MLTSTNVKYTSRNPSDSERSGLGPSSEDIEQNVDDIFLANEDRDEKVGDDGVGNLSCVRLVGCRKADEYAHVCCKGDAEKPSVNGEERITEISNRLGLLLVDVLIIEITLPPGGFLFADGVSRAAVVNRSGDGTPGLRSGSEISDTGCLNGQLWHGNGPPTE